MAMLRLLARDSGDVVLAQALYGVTKNLFLGLRLQSTHIKTELDLSEVGNRLGVSLPAIDLDHRTVSSGHFMAEEAPGEVITAVRDLLAR